MWLSPTIQGNSLTSDSLPFTILDLLIPHAQSNSGEGTKFGKAVDTVESKGQGDEQKYLFLRILRHQGATSLVGSKAQPS